MPLTKCPRSGVLFNSDQGPVHPDCMAEEEADYERVLGFLRDNPSASPASVAKTLGIDPGVITRMSDQGIIKTLSDAELEKRRKELMQKDLQRLNSRLSEQIASIELPEKKKVEIGGTVRSALQNKRKIE